MEEFKKENSLLKGKGEEDTQWITVKGSHIPIKDGESANNAIKKFKELQGHQKSENIKGQRKTLYLELPPKEYGKVCSLIKTKYANNIPKDGGIFDKNHYYVYNCNEDEKIICKAKIKIEGNEEIINKWEDIWR